MTTYQWTESTRPDRPGIWQCRGCKHPHAVTQEDVNLSRWVEGDWAFLMDLPEIKDPPKYRDVRKGDEAKTIQVKVDGNWFDCYFVGFLKSGDVAYEGKDFAMKAKPADCRILDDGEPAKQQREWWINIYSGNYSDVLHSTKKQAEESSSNNRKECVHVREVIE